MSLVLTFPPKVVTIYFVLYEDGVQQRSIHVKVNMRGPTFGEVVPCPTNWRED